MRLDTLPSKQETAALDRSPASRHVSAFADKCSRRTGARRAGAVILRSIAPRQASAHVTAVARTLATGCVNRTLKPLPARGSVPATPPAPPSSATPHPLREHRRVQPLVRQPLPCRPFVVSVRSRVRGGLPGVSANPWGLSHPPLSQWNRPPAPTSEARVPAARSCRTCRDLNHPSGHPTSRRTHTTAAPQR